MRLLPAVAPLVVTEIHNRRFDEMPPLPLTRADEVGLQIVDRIRGLDSCPRKLAGRCPWRH